MSIYVIIKNFLPILLYGIRASNLDEARVYKTKNIYIL